MSLEDFMKVQNILEKNHSGYQHKKEEDDRPLTRLLKCDNCEGYMVGYKSNQKNLHYYRCLKCRGVSLNAKTTPKSKGKGAEQLFIELLEQYRIPNNLFPLVELQLTKLFTHYDANNALNESQLQKQLVTLQNQLRLLKIRFGLNEIDKETYEITMEHLVETDAGNQQRSEQRKHDNI